MLQVAPFVKILQIEQYDLFQKHLVIVYNAL